MLKLNRGDQAKSCFIEALTLDVKCYDAFNQLVGGEMMTPDEGMLATPCVCILMTIHQNGSSFKDSRTSNKPKTRLISFN